MAADLGNSFLDGAISRGAPITSCEGGAGIHRRADFKGEPQVAADMTVAGIQTTNIG